MSSLEKTILVPNTNPDTILNQKILKLLVITNNLELVEKANNLALDPPTAIDRYVVWYKTPDFTELKNKFPALPDNLAQVQAFSLSTKNKIADVIKTSETVDYPRIDKSFTKAGLPEFN